MSLLTYCMNIMMSLMMLSMVFVMLAMSVASAERICEVLNEKSDITNPENADKTVPDGSITFDQTTGDANKDMAYIKKAADGAFEFVKTQSVEG